MAEIKKSKAICLHSIPWSDTSRIAYFLTPTNGVLHLIARGAMRPKSAFAGVLVPFLLTEIVYTEKATRELQILKEVFVLHHFPNLHSQPEFFVRFAILAEMLLKTVHGSEDISRYFDHIIRVLVWMEEDTTRMNPGLLNLFLGLSTQHGFTLSYRKCVGCGSEKYDQGFISIATGELYCRSCRHRAQQEMISLSADTIIALRKSVPFDHLIKNQATVDNMVLLEVGQFLEKYFSYHFHHHFRWNSLEVFREFLNPGQK